MNNYKIVVAFISIIVAGCTLRGVYDTRKDDMYKEYGLKRVNQPVEINADWNKPAWQGIESIRLLQYMGKEPEHRPETQVKLAWDDANVYAIFRVEDLFVRAVATEYFENVCWDSCVEFFFTPQEGVAVEYFNLETNCIGTILMSHKQTIDKKWKYLDIKDLNRIQIATSLPKGQVIDPEIAEPVTWTIEYAIPIEILKQYMKVATPAPGVTWRANFYKCADKTSHPHWLTWSNIPLEKPSFHQPQYFGYLQFVE